MSGNPTMQENPEVQSVEQRLTTKPEIFGKPSKPRDLEIAFSSEIQVFLKWESPESDGGSPVTGYCIEVLDKVGNWREKKWAPSNRKISSVVVVEPERVYTFRVIAVNEVGAGDPSNIVQYTVPKPKGHPPMIKPCSLHTVAKDVGDSFSVRWFVEAEPSAVVTWKWNGRFIKDERVKITYENCYARIEVHRCKKSDSGTFSITATNEYGRREQEIFELVVEDGVLRKLGKAALYTVGASAAILGGIAVAVPAMGFTAGGVAAGSLAAAYQSAALGGTIASGSAFATLQSIGAAGLAASTQAGVVGATGAASLFSVFRKKEPKK